MASAFAVMGCLVVSAGCGGGSAAAGGKVEHAELYRSGNSDYDDFFEDLHDLQQKAKPNLDEERNARGPLVEVVGASSTLDDLVRKVRERAEELAQTKQKVRFEIDGLDEQGLPIAGRPLSVKPVVKGKLVPKDALSFASALEASARSEGQIWEKYSPLADRVRNMNDRLSALLERVEAEFPSSDKRGEVQGELKAARSALEQAGMHADKIVAASSKFLKGVSEAVAAPASAEPPKKDKEKATKEKDRKPSVAKAPRPSGPPASKSRETASAKANSNGASKAASGSAPPHTSSPSPPPGDFNP